MDAVDMLKNISELNIKDLCIETAKDNEDEMVKLNEDQLAAGLRANDTDIEPLYRPYTIFIKETQKTGLASVTDVVTLFDTGAHYAGLYAEVKGSIIEYGSKDSKSADLQEKYGKIYGLNTDSRDVLIEEHIEPDLHRKVEKQTGLKFKK